MTFHYVVIRYVPNPLNGEFINIGVILTAGDDTWTDWQFLTHWERAEVFCGKDTRWLQAFAASFSLHVPTVETLAFLATYWQDTLQLDDIHTMGTDDPDALLDELCQRYLVDR